MVDAFTYDLCFVDVQLDYGCALQREILVQGRIYISENHICFHANIFGWVTDVSPTFIPSSPSY